MQGATCGHTSFAVGLSDGDCCQQSIMRSRSAGKAGSKFPSCTAGLLALLMAMLAWMARRFSNGLSPVSSS